MLHLPALRRPFHALVLLVLVASSARAQIQLTAVRFPADVGGTGPGGLAPPTEVALSQAIVFDFSGVPVLGAAPADGLRIRVSGQNPLFDAVGEPAFGDYQVIGNSVIFRPRLPTMPLPADFGPATDLTALSGLSGMRPATHYQITISLGPTGVSNLVGVAPSVTLPIGFRTRGAAPYFGYTPDPAPRRVGVRPDSTAGLHPNLFSDPAGLFATIPLDKRTPFRVRFDVPLNPTQSNIDQGLRMRILQQPNGNPVDLPLPVTRVLTHNSALAAQITVFPNGILPLGHVVVLELSDQLTSLTGKATGALDHTPTYTEIARYTVATDPQAGLSLDDAVLETFASNVREDTGILQSEGLALAAWDQNDSDVLQASYGLGADGSLGRFLALNVPSTITLDTDFQVLPLASGATPDVLPGTVVTGGVFHFTEFVLPANVTLVARGSHPLVITVTGDARIEGRIDLNGVDGSRDDTFDSGIFPVAGGTAGAGGGRGGDGHPVPKFVGMVDLQGIQTPQFGESGHGPGNVAGGGGGGGQSGCTLPWSGFAAGCGDFFTVGDGSRGSGGGGGSYGPFLPLAPENPAVAVSGRRGGIGIGNHLPVAFDPDQPIPPVPAAYQGLPGNPTNAVARDNPNPTFTAAWHAGLIYDIGTPMAVDASAWALSHRVLFGGSAGPVVFHDADPNNDFIGPGGELSVIQGGQGGGGGGSRSEGLDQMCKPQIFDAGLPFTLLDAKGAGGGGAGGALRMQVLGTLRIQGPMAKIEAMGGDGAGGEQTGASNRGGSSGGGSGGAIVLEAGVALFMNDPTLPATVIDVSGGTGHAATNLSTAPSTGLPGADATVLQVGDGGPGGPGIVQIHAPDPNLIDAARIRARVSLSAFDITTTGLSTMQPLVDMTKTPVTLSKTSTGRSTWIDLGAVTRPFRPKISTPAGLLAGPLFGVPGQAPFFQGTDPITGRVITDASGFIPNAANLDLAVDAPDLGLSDFIPNGPAFFQTVTVRFQGADESMDEPGSPDLLTLTPWVTDIRALNGRQFLRFEVVFDIAAQPGQPLGPTTPKPAVDFLRIPFKF